MSDKAIADGLYRFQSALNQAGSSMTEFVSQNYVNKWTSDAIYHVMAIRTTFVNSMHNFLTDRGLLNMERVSMSPVTDPLAHDIEHAPTIMYKGLPYKTTHSMIYSKFLACFNPKTPGIFVDSPNIRLEMESPTGKQRGRYLVDFSQMDIEFKRSTVITEDQYYNDKAATIEKLKADRDEALKFFEDMVILAVEEVIKKNSNDLAALKVKMVVPTSPFPRITNDEAIKRTGTKAFEKQIGPDMASPFFWVTGLMRENYDLIYPYLNEDGSKRPISDFTSEDIYNYDLCAQSVQLDGTYGDCYEVMSGAVREWLYDPIAERLLDNKILKARPKFSASGELENVDELEGYAPFLIAAHMKGENGKPYFPCTSGGGLGIERCLLAMLNGPVITQVDQVTLFGKNPDSFPVYLY